MPVAPQGIGGAEHENGSEEIPLDLEPGVGAEAESVAHQGISGADEAGQQHAPIGDAPEALVDPIDRTTDPQQSAHHNRIAFSQSPSPHGSLLTRVALGSPSFPGPAVFPLPGMGCNGRLTISGVPMRKLTLAATQYACGPDSAGNLDKAETLVRRAAAQGGEVVLLQELFETPYFCKDQLARLFAL